MSWLAARHVTRDDDDGYAPLAVPWPLSSALGEGGLICVDEHGFFVTMAGHVEVQIMPTTMSGGYHGPEWGEWEAAIRAARLWIDGKPEPAPVLPEADPALIYTKNHGDERSDR